MAAASASSGPTSGTKAKPPMNRRSAIRSPSSLRTSPMGCVVPASPGDLAVDQVQDQSQRRQQWHRQQQDRRAVRQRQAKPAEGGDGDGSQRQHIGAHPSRHAGIDERTHQSLRGRLHSI